jgi:hypothetical protein
LPKMANFLGCRVSKFNENKTVVVARGNE